MDLNIGKPLPLTGEAIQEEVEAIVKRTNDKITLARRLPPNVLAQIDISYLDDISFLVRYITALQALIVDVHTEKHGPSFNLH